MAAAAAVQPSTVLAFPEQKPADAVTTHSIVTNNSLLEIDREIDGILDTIQDDIDELGEPRPESKQRFELFCEAFGEKVDRLGRFVRVMEARAKYCREESARMTERARCAENRIAQIKSFVMFFLASRGITKMEGPSFTLRVQKNAQDSVVIENPASVPLRLSRVEVAMDGADFATLAAALPPELSPLLTRCIRSVTPVNDLVKQAVADGEKLTGVAVKRGYHVRVV